MGVWGKVADLPPQRGRPFGRPSTLGTFSKGTDCKARVLSTEHAADQLAGLPCVVITPPAVLHLRRFTADVTSSEAIYRRRHHLRRFIADVTTGVLLRVEPRDTPVF